MKRGKVRRICKIIFAVSSVVMAISAIVAFGSAMCCVHGNISAVLPLAVSVAIFWLASEMGEAVERRINGSKSGQG